MITITLLKINLFLIKNIEKYLFIYKEGVPLQSKF